MKSCSVSSFSLPSLQPEMIMFNYIDLLSLGPFGQIGPFWTIEIYLKLVPSYSTSQQFGLMLLDKPDDVYDIMHDSSSCFSLTGAKCKFCLFQLNLF